MTASEFQQEPSKALDYVASPEQLDQLMQVVKPKNWVPAMTIGGLTAIALVWSVVGRLPIAVSGQGVLISPQRVVELQSPVTGQLEVLNVKDGQAVKQGEILAAIQPLELAEQLKQLQAKRQQLLGQASNIEALQQQRTQVERGAIAATRASLLQRLQDAQSLSPYLTATGLDHHSTTAPKPPAANTGCPRHAAHIERPLGSTEAISEGRSLRPGLSGCCRTGVSPRSCRTFKNCRHSYGNWM